MLNSSEKLNFIQKYMTEYETKLKLNNSLGLYDEAKLFEIFAQCICKIWFNMPFSNLNEKVSNYPYVDLISEDGSIYVQVTTNMDVPNKIKTTLEKIRDSKRSEVSGITQLFFFVLSNDSVQKVKSYTGQEQIGRIQFDKTQNLITTKDIVNKASVNNDFLDKLYLALKNDYESVKGNLYYFNEAVDLSKKQINLEYPCLINNEYEIDRSSIIDKINQDNYQFISIQGEAGSGKSVVCKKLTDTKDNVLFIKADRLASISNSNDIWKFKIDELFSKCPDKEITIFVDALEFIADNRKSSFDVLFQLYAIVNKYKNVKIISSCRTCDVNSFVKLATEFNIHSYEVPMLDDNELLLIIEKYPIVGEIMQMERYRSICRSPFYINLIVSQVKDVDSIRNVVNFREYIWENVICLKEKSKDYGILFNDVVSIVNNVVFSRAQSFSVYVDCDRLNAKIIDVLVTEGIIILNDHGQARLKYDIFEDIVFDHSFDIEFRKCKGNYKTFFNTIEGYGKCVYRRFQIWIENKLFIEETHDKYIYQLISAQTIPEKWKEQTIIGITKSRYCKPFFDDYGKLIIDSEMISDFIRITNIYSFQIRSFCFEGKHFIEPQPIGMGRPCLIDLVCNNIKESQWDNSIVKLCQDYSKQNKKDMNYSQFAGSILCKKIESCIQADGIYHRKDEINSLLLSVYRLVKATKNWISTFWSTLIDYYKGDVRWKRRLSEDIMLFTIQNTNPNLSIELSKELCELAEVYWTYPEPDADNRFFYSEYDRMESLESLYGLNTRAENYKYDFRKPEDNSFLCMLNQFNLTISIEWTIKFLNLAVEEYVKRIGKKDNTIEIFYVKTKTKKSFYGNEKMWMAGIMENEVPALFGDMIYLLKSYIINMIKQLDKKDKKRAHSTIASIFKYIVDHTNNVLLISMIADIAILFSYDYPGLAVDFASSLEIVLWDYYRIAFYNPSYMQKEYEKVIFKSVFLESIPKRYSLLGNKEISMSDYIALSQVSASEEIKDHCENLLDYLYRLVKDERDNSQLIFQIQKMDMRLAEKQQISEQVSILIPKSNDKETSVSEQQNPVDDLIKLIEESIHKANTGTLETEDCIEIINKLNSLIDTNVFIPLPIAKWLIQFIAYALKKETLSGETRDKLCDIWTKGLRKLLQNDSFIFDYNTSEILFEQVELDINDNTRQSILRLMIESLLRGNESGIIRDISKSVSSYLSRNQPLGKRIFYTLIELAKDKKSLKGIRYQNNASDLQKVDYTSQKEIIIAKYLFSNNLVDVTDFKVQKYDISILSRIGLCRLSIDDDEYSSVLCALVHGMIEEWHTDKGLRYQHSFNYYDSDCISNALSAYLIINESTSKKVIEIMFNNIDFSIFEEDTLDFYLQVYSAQAAYYFDAYQDRARRSLIESNMAKLENAVCTITDEKAKKNMYKLLIFANYKYSNPDWSKYKTSYSYTDKMFLGRLFSAYGHYHLEDLLKVIYKMKIKELLPETILSIEKSFSKAELSKQGFFRLISNPNTQFILDLIITEALIEYSDIIKMDNDLSDAFENLLLLLSGFDYEKAAIILDSFRVN